MGHGNNRDRHCRAAVMLAVAATPFNVLAVPDDSSVQPDISVTGTTAKVKLSSIQNVRQPVSLEGFAFEGSDVLGDVPNATPTELATDTAPGTKGGGGVITRITADDLVPGNVYLLIYEVGAGPGNPFIPGNSPFDNSLNPLSGENGKTHSYLLTVKDGFSGTGDLPVINNNGGQTGYVRASVTKAQWEFQIPTEAVSANVGSLSATNEATNPAGGTYTAGGTITRIVADNLSPGDVYQMDYEVTSGPGNPFIPPASPFSQAPNPLPGGVGVHSVLLTVEEGFSGTGEAIVVNSANFGSGTTYANVSLRKVSLNAAAGQTLEYQLAVGASRPRYECTTPLSGHVYFSNQGNDFTGTGSQQHPLRQPNNHRFEAGTTIWMGMGGYDPFTALDSGTAAAKITVRAMPGHERLVMFIGDFSEIDDGPGAENGVPALPQEGRDALYMDSLDHWEFHDIYFGNVYRSAAFTRGTDGETNGNIHFEGCVFSFTGASCVTVCGENFDTPLKRDGTTNPLTQYVTFNECDFSRNDLPTPYNGLSPQGHRGSSVEILQIGNEAWDVVATNCDFRDGNSYGPNIKSGARRCFLIDCRIWNMRYHLLYMDAGQAYVIGCGYIRCRAWRGNNGIVMAREAKDGNATILRDNEIRDCWVHDVDQVLAYFQIHPKDRLNGDLGEISGNIWDGSVFYDGAKDGTTRAIRLDDLEAEFPNAVALGEKNEFTNNAFGGPKDITLFDGWTGRSRFVVSSNLNFAQDAPDNSIFKAPNVVPFVGKGHRPVIRIPDFTM